MKALILSSEFPPGPGGIGAHALALARGLVDRGWGLEVLTRQDYVDVEEIEAFNRREDYPIGILPRQRIARLLRARDVARRSGADVIVASGAASVWIASRIGGDTAKVAMAHGTELTAGSGFRRAATRQAFRSMDGIVCVSHHTRDVARDAGIDGPPLEVIPNGADAGRFRPLTAEEIATTRHDLTANGDATDGPVLLTVGHVSHRKAQDVMIRALPAVAKVHPGVRYLVAGLPSRQPEYERLARALGVSRHVTFLGRVPEDDLPRIYGASDLFVLVSRTDRGDFEGYGIAAIEAALCGRPTLATRGSGLEEAVLDGETGLLVPADDPEATADAVLGLLADDALLRRLGATALERARGGQTWEHRMAAYEAFLTRAATS